MCAVLLPIIVQCVNNDRGRCGVQRLGTMRGRSVGDEARRAARREID